MSSAATFQVHSRIYDKLLWKDLKKKGGGDLHLAQGLFDQVLLRTWKSEDALLKAKASNQSSGLFPFSYSLHLTSGPEGLAIPPPLLPNFSAEARASDHPRSRRLTAPHPHPCQPPVRPRRQAPLPCRKPHGSSVHADQNQRLRLSHAQSPTSGGQLNKTNMLLGSHLRV